MARGWLDGEGMVGCFVESTPYSSFAVLLLCAFDSVCGFSQRGSLGGFMVSERIPNPYDLVCGLSECSLHFWSLRL